MGVRAHGQDDPTFSSPDGKPPSEGLRDIVPVLAFLRREIDQSAAILGDLVRCLSHEICALGAAADREFLLPMLSEATVALQNEDRIQQRLRDLGAVLSVLESVLAEGGQAGDVDLERAIVESLRLEETRNAFAVEVGLSDKFSQPSSPAETPSVGEIDLF